jgi:hypothetical protein
VKVSYHVFKDLKLDVAGATDEEIILERKKHAAKIRRLRYSFVSLCWHPGRKTLFVGATHGGGDLLLEFDPTKSRFKSCGYAKSGLLLPVEAKIHKGLWLDEKEDALYFGTAALGYVPLITDTPGGALVRYDVKKRKFRLIARPTPGDFYQAVCRDKRRNRIYAWTRRGCFAVYDTKKRKLVRYEAMESAPHIGCIDDAGGVWGVYGGSDQAFYRYVPGKDRFEFPKGCRLPNALEATDVMYIGAGPVDSMINGGDGFLYVGAATGEFYRLDPRKGKLDYIGKPFTGKRLPGMALGEDGMIYLCGGREKFSWLARYSREEDRFEMFGEVRHADGTGLHYCHELVVADGVVYAGETDNPSRSGYLWTCEV